jgi:hypothetical protein
MAGAVRNRYIAADTPPTRQLVWAIQETGV